MTGVDKGTTGMDESRTKAKPETDSTVPLILFVVIVAVMAMLGANKFMDQVAMLSQMGQQFR